MASIGFLAHSRREGAFQLAQETGEWLLSLGHHVRMIDGDPLGGWPPPTLDASLGSLDLLISLGGDGTMLRCVDLAAPVSVPVLGVNFGHLGYLTVVEPGELRKALGRFLEGDYAVESRMTVDMTVRDPSRDLEVLSRTALNDIVIQRPHNGHTVRIEATIGGMRFLTFAADSLIVSTPTGSTAYNLSARGPIVSPRARVQILTPVAPHMLFDRSLVLADEQVSLVSLEEEPAELVVDGWPAGVLHPGYVLTCSQGRRDALLVTWGERDFHHILRRKFNLSDR